MGLEDLSGLTFFGGATAFRVLESVPFVCLADKTSTDQTR